MTAGKPLFVRVRNLEGKYLAGGGVQMEFCDDIKKARVFDCRRDQVEEQLAYLRLAHGIVLEVQPVDPMEIHEVCDRCGRMALSFQMYFDGKHYLCTECRASVANGLSLS
jgi:hypothetical protein